MAKKEPQYLDKPNWPKSLIENNFQGELEISPWSEHGVKIPEQYQVKVHGELSPTHNYVSFEEAKSIKPLEGILDHSYGQLRGISATGKGTRMYQLVSFLKTQFKWTFFQAEVPAYREKKEDGTVPVYTVKNFGIFFPELKLLIPGRIVKSNKSRLLSFTGADMITSGWSHDTLFDLNLKFATQYNWLYEGYTGLDNGKLNPKWLEESTAGDIHNYFYRMYHHPDKEEMLARFKSRSYTVAKGDAAYSQNENHSTISYNTILKETEDLNVNCDIKLHESTEPMEEFIFSYMGFLGFSSAYAEMHEEWAETHNYKRDYQDAQQNYDNFWYDWQFQTQYEQAKR